MILFAQLAGCTHSGPDAEVSRTETRIEAEIDSVFNRMMEAWYPRVIDTVYGGYLSDFSHDWRRTGPQNKMIVTQARHVWTTSKVAARDTSSEAFPDYAAHGYAFLHDRFWDERNGGFFTLLSREGEVIPNRGEATIKLAYGNAFAIYALAAYHKASGDTAALDLAKRGFRWLEEHSHDPVHGGYFQFLSVAGDSFSGGYDGVAPKDQNSSIHLMEAFAELYEAWPDPLLRRRLTELFRLIRDEITTERGYMELFFERDWTPVSYRDSTRDAWEEQMFYDHVSFGHDIETAFLLLETAHVLDFPEDSVLSQAKRMTDHTIENGWDEQYGGFFDRGYYFRGEDSLTVVDSSKVWWSQAEALNTLLIMARRFPDDPHHYFDKFVRQWEYIKHNLIDREQGGWYETGLDMDPEAEEAPKAHIWKGNYHTARTLMRCLDRLREK
ncbi:MAG: AGE family epimerase/isomerase [Balneolaceae bacterium]|nr:AGE family epimerase/isomerase [Balneolaceae bacterium]